ncbi:MAG TPA: hypothetical protein VLI93_15600 [Acetobacteraceae bacterium]|nr:hypothetical protein [Acetobacteraceae bacterium]
MAMLPASGIKRGRASLIGGIAVGICVLGLWLGIAHELGYDGVVVGMAGAVVAACIAAWIRIADL